MAGAIAGTNASAMPAPASARLNVSRSRWSSARPLADRGPGRGRHRARQIFLVVVAERAPFAPRLDPPRPRAARVARRDARIVELQGGETREPLIGVGEEARLGHLAVRDHVDADVGLPAD